VRCPIIITNDELRKQTNEIKITEQITRLKWNWIGHCLRKENAVEKEAMGWNPQEQRKEEGQGGVDRKQYKRKPWLLGRHFKKLNNSARIM
jgi:hypothetical protein